MAARLATWGLALDGKALTMAVGIRIKLPGITQEQFDQAHDHINPDRTPPDGMIFHFWESRASFDAFSSPFAEGMAPAGLEPNGAPDIGEFRVHETISG